MRPPYGERAPGSLRIHMPPSLLFSILIANRRIADSQSQKRRPGKIAYEKKRIKSLSLPTRDYAWRHLSGERLSKRCFARI
jgi:hypothetical protein